MMIAVTRRLSIHQLPYGLCDQKYIPVVLTVFSFENPENAAGLSPQSNILKIEKKKKRGGGNQAISLIFAGPF